MMPFSFQTLIVTLVFLTGLRMNIKAAEPPKDELPNSPILRTMSRELDRSMKNLHIKASPPLYFLSYLLWDVKSYHMEASLGFCEVADSDRQHMLETNLRVGDYQMDNTNFQGGIVFGPHLRLPLPQENDTTLLALSIWATTDARYKVAVEQFAQKKAFLTNHTGRDSLPDFSRQKVFQKVDGDEPSDPDTAASKALGVDLSRHLAQFPWLQESRVGYQYYFTTFYYVDSEGSRYIQTIKEHTLLVSLFTQAEDGEPLWDYLRISSRSPMDLGKGALSLASLKDSLAPMLKRLEFLRKSPPLANYRGPVLFTGSASGELLNKALLAPQKKLREPIGASAETNFMLSLAHRKLFPGEITVIDTPSMAQYRGRSLYGHYALDHQGQLAQDIVLIKAGRVNNYLLGKVPVAEARNHQSNGHWRYGGGYPGIAWLKSSLAISEPELRTKLSTLGLEEGSGAGLIVRKLLDEDAFKLLHHPLASQIITSDGMDGSGAFALAGPCEIDRLDARTGKVTPVRGLSFPAIDSKSLRDIVAVGSDPFLHEPQAAFSILCPSLLFSLLDLKGGRRSQPHLPLIP